MHGCGISVTVISAKLYLFSLKLQLYKKDGPEMVKIQCKMIGDDGGMWRGIEMNEIVCSDD